jgi:hypothetical protein
MEIKIFTHLSNNENEGDEYSYFIYYPNYFNEKEKCYMRRYLDGMDDFKYNINANYTGNVRLQKWYQTNCKYFSPKWKYTLPWWESFKYDKILLNIQKKILFDISNKTILGNIFNKYNINIPNINSCLINKYRDGQDHIIPHNNIYNSFGKYPTICGLSIGDTRYLRVKSIVNNYKKINGLSKLNKGICDVNFDYLLEDGSLLIMAGASQKYFSNEIIKNMSSKTRYSLTFREFII